MPARKRVQQQSRSPSTPASTVTISSSRSHSRSPVLLHAIPAHEALSIAVVLDPSFAAASLDEAQGITWFDPILVGKDTLDSERLARLCGELPGCVFHDLEESKEGDDIYWIVIYESFGRKDIQWEIRYIFWEEFARIARRHSDPEIAELEGLDLVIMPRLGTDLWSAPFGLRTQANVKNFLSAASRLEDRYPLWPKLAELMLKGDSFTCAKDLDKIAHLMGNARPRTIVPSLDTWLPKRGQVIKRCMSKGGQHNIYHKGRSIIPSAARRFGDLPTPDPERARWYMQEYVPIFRTAGCVYVFLGRRGCAIREWCVLQRVVVAPTEPPELDEWEWSDFTCPLPFEDLRSLPIDKWTSETLQEDYSDSLTEDEVAARLRPWDDFAVETLERFVDIEEQRMGTPSSSSLRVLALVEVGFIENPQTSKLDPFAHGITRYSDIFNLWTGRGTGNADRHETLAESVEISLKMLIRDGVVS
ncbi:hypothetical protein BOTBODRAFT_185572 [Botryobasidium botryosum FD-172 SS1]|uniref:Uncharacterized protein n=1 Tax=Botryobasidium botryosum (strain FD-172 SS1) TaxID=930990 RepID=A0A067N241_BOTB1|nr:hypothetical protein BOTBODRAFT_185572 [Botryobasidium botryosum FD-172 SS1]